MKNFLHSIADYIRETDKLLLSLCIAASFYGSILVLSTTRYTGDKKQFYIQLVALVLGVAVAVVISMFDYRTISKFWLIFAIICVGLIVYTRLYGLTPTGTNDKAWVSLPGGLTFQPSELVKITFIITFSRHVYKIGKDINKPLNVLLLCIHGAIPALVIHFIQGDDGTALVLAFIFLIMLFVAGIQMRYFAVASVIAVISAPFVWFLVLNSDQRDRIFSVFNPNADLLGKNWQSWQGRLAIGTGGFSGYGLFKGPIVQGNILPKSHNDFIFASAGEELGFLGCIAIIILLVAIFLRILRIGALAKDKMASVIAAGVFATLAVGAVVNIGMCLSILPVIGITLPFFSSGGSSLVSSYIGIGLILSIYMNRHKRQTYLRDLGD